MQWIPIQFWNKRHGGTTTIRPRVTTRTNRLTVLTTTRQQEQRAHENECGTAGCSCESTIMPALGGPLCGWRFTGAKELSTGGREYIFEKDEVFSWHELWQGPVPRVGDKLHLTQDCTYDEGDDQPLKLARGWAQQWGVYGGPAPMDLQWQCIANGRVVKVVGPFTPYLGETYYSIVFRRQ